MASCAFLSAFLGARIVFAGLPVSYGREIAPIFAFHCTGCHGLSNPSSNFQVTKFTALRTGGNIGDEIVAGSPEKSILLDFLEGKRGPRQRMPQDSQPLSSGQIALIRRWISEGAENDRAKTACFDLRIPGVAVSASGPLEIEAESSIPAFLVLTLRDPSLRKPLFVEEASVNAPRERANIAAPGEWFHRSLRREENWPASVTVSLRFQYAEHAPIGSVMTVTSGSVKRTMTTLRRGNCGPL